MFDYARKHSLKMYIPQLKGYTKITLHNPTTGKNEVVEKHNLITNAVADLLVANLNAQGNFSKCLPLKQFYSGVLCFDDIVTENAAAYYPPSEGQNRLTAHAGDEAHSTASLLRGNPNGAEMIETDNAIKFVWDWTTSQGNGRISAVCLCPNRLGNMGLKPFDDSYHPFMAINTPNENARMNPNQYTRNYAIQHPISMDFETGLGKALWFTTDTVEEITVKHEMLKFGILRDSTPSTFIEISHRETLSLNTSLTAKKWALYEDSNNYYTVQASNATTLQMNIINKQTWTCTGKTFTITGGSVLNTTSDTQFGKWTMFPHFPLFDGYFFFPKSTLDAWYKVNIDNGSFTEIAGTIAQDLHCPARPIRISSDLYVGQDYLYNSGVFYPIAASDTLFTVDGSSVTKTDARYNGRNYLTNGSPALWANEVGNYVNANGLMVNEMFLSSINNIDPVQKSSAQAMKIEYTLTEVG